MWCLHCIVQVYMNLPLKWANSYSRVSIPFPPVQFWLATTMQANVKTRPSKQCKYLIWILIFVFLYGLGSLYWGEFILYSFGVGSYKTLFRALLLTKSVFLDANSSQSWFDNIGLPHLVNQIIPQVKAIFVTCCICVTQWARIGTQMMTFVTRDSRYICAKLHLLTSFASLDQVGWLA